MSGKLVGWVIILVALAVPAYLFYNWQTKMKAQSTTFEVPRKPEGGAFGGAARPSSGTVAGVASSTAAVPTAPSASAPQAQNPQSPAAAPAAQAPQDANSSSQGAAAAGPPATASAKRPGTPTVEYNPSTQRDPTISPIDLKKMAVEKQQQDMIDAEKRYAAEESKKPKKKEAKNEPSCEERLQLYGIISMPSGNAAMVNNSTVREGDTIEGAVVKKITTGTVVFQCRGRPIIKKVSK